MDLLSLDHLQTLVIRKLINWNLDDFLSLPLCASLTYLDVSRAENYSGTRDLQPGVDRQHVGKFNRFPNLLTYLARDNSTPLTTLVLTSPSLTELDCSADFGALRERDAQGNFVTIDRLVLVDLLHLQRLKILRMKGHIFSRTDFQIFLDSFPHLRLLEMSNSNDLTLAQLTMLETRRPEIRIVNNKINYSF